MAAPIDLSQFNAARHAPESAAPAASPFDAFARGGFAGQASPEGPTDVVNLSTMDLSVKRTRILWPGGDYDGRVVDCQYVQSKSGAKNWNFKTVIQVWDQAGATQKLYDYKGFRDAEGNLLEGEKLVRLANFLRTVNPEIDLAAIGPDTVPAALIDRPVRVKVKIGDPYQGERKNEIQDVFSAGEDFFNN